MLPEDDIGQKIKVDAHQVNQKITIVKEEMKKLSLQENVTKMDEMKQLQQEAQAIHDRECTRNDEMETYQSKAVRVTGLIQPVQQKLQHITQSLEEGPSKHINSDRVKQLQKQAKEVRQEVSKVQQILKEFQYKVGHVTQPKSDPEA